MAHANQPAIVFAHGAWHTPDHLANFGKQATEAGFIFEVPQLPSTTSEYPLPGNASLAGDTAAYRGVVEKYTERGHPVIAMSHSWGDAAATNALEGLSWKERAATGRSGGVIHLIYIAAFMMPTGVSVLELMGFRKDKSWSWQSSNDAGDVVIVPEQRAIDVLFHDAPDQEMAKEYARTLLPYAAASRERVLTYAAYKHIPTTYILCENDRAMPLAFQKLLVDKAGVPIETVTLAGGHSPFLYDPKALIDASQKAYTNFK